MVDANELMRMKKDIERSSPRTWGCFNNNNYGGNVNDY